MIWLQRFALVMIGVVLGQALTIFTDDEVARSRAAARAAQQCEHCVEAAALCRKATR